MAQYTKVLFIDDLDGGAADQTVAFGLDGKSYEIDLSTRNAQLLRDALSLFVNNARTVQRSAGRGGHTRPTKPASKSEPVNDSGEQPQSQWAAAPADLAPVVDTAPHSQAADVPPAQFSDHG